MIGRRRTEGPDERGFTMLEVVVGMTILSIFLSIFTGSMISMFRSVNRTQQTAYAQSEISQVFAKLDREIRYASGISQPATDVFATGDAVVEFVTSSSGDPVCTQLRLSPAGDLQQRTWGQNDLPIVPSSPVSLGVDLSADTPKAAAGPDTTVAGPFAMLAAVGSLSNEQLEVALNARESSQASRTSRVRHVDVTFSALNTGTSTSSASVCSQGRSITWPAT